MSNRVSFAPYWIANLNTSFNWKIHFHILLFQIVSHVIHFEVFVDLEWAEIVRCILVKNDAFNRHASRNICIDLALDLCCISPSWVGLGTSENAKCIEWRQWWEANLMLIPTDDFLCTTFYGSIHLNVVSHCHVVEDNSIKFIMVDCNYLKRRSCSSNEEKTKPLILIKSLT